MSQRILDYKIHMKNTVLKEGSHKYMENGVTPLSSHRPSDDSESSSGRIGRCEEEVCWSNIVPGDTWCSHAITCQEQLSFPKSPTHRQWEKEKWEKGEREQETKKIKKKRMIQRVRENKEWVNEIARQDVNRQINPIHLTSDIKRAKGWNLVEEETINFKLCVRIRKVVIGCRNR